MPAGVTSGTWNFTAVSSHIKSCARVKCVCVNTVLQHVIRIISCSSMCCLWNRYIWLRHVTKIPRAGPSHQWLKHWNIHEHSPTPLFLLNNSLARVVYKPKELLYFTSISRFFYTRVPLSSILAYSNVPCVFCFGYFFISTYGTLSNYKMISCFNIYVVWGFSGCEI